MIDSSVKHFELFWLISSFKYFQFFLLILGASILNSFWLILTSMIFLLLQFFEFFWLVSSFKYLKFFWFNSSFNYLKIFLFILASSILNYFVWVLVSSFLIFFYLFLIKISWNLDCFQSYVFGMFLILVPSILNFLIDSSFPHICRLSMLFGYKNWAAGHSCLKMVGEFNIIIIENWMFYLPTS